MEVEKLKVVHLGEAISFPVIVFLVVDRGHCCFLIAGGSDRQGWSNR